jgi:hypothetical protein
MKVVDLLVSLVDAVLHLIHLVKQHSLLEQKKEKFIFAQKLMLVNI